MIKLIIFDIGDVLIYFNDEQYICYITGKLHINEEQFKKDLQPLIKKMEYGAIGLQDTENALSRRFKVSKRGLEWVESYRKMARMNRPVFNLIKRLHKKYRIALLSNVGRARYIEGLRLINRVSADHIFASCYIKMRKPEPRIYRYALGKMGMKPGETIFIDNLRENVKGAMRVGIRSIVFTDYAHLVKSLKALGIRA